MVSLDFETELLNGKTGEDVVSQFIEGLEGMIDVVDVSDRPACQGIDVDFICVKNDLETSSGIRTFTMEVKTSYTEIWSRSFVFQTKSCVETDRAGWLYRCRADFLAYYFVADSAIFLMDFPEVKNYLISNVDSFRLVQTERPGVGDSSYVQEFILVPRNELLGRFPQKIIGYQLE